MRNFAIIVISFLAAVPVGSASAQIVRGQVVEEGTEKPIWGAFVILFDGQGARRSAALADSSGHFIIRAPGPGRYTLQMERIGFRSRTSPVLELVAGQTLNHRFIAPVEPIALEGISASGTSRCHTPREVGAETALLWEEARKALTVSEWVRTDRGVPFQTRLYERGRNLLSLEIDDQRAWFRSEVGKSPFYSESAQGLATNGYVRRLPGEVFQYFGLDAATLLSEDFLETHCFRIRDSGRGEEGLIGLGFEPVPTHHQPDITGVFWLNRASSELRYIEFQFTQHLHPVRVPLEPFGGRIEFRHLVNGVWTVDRWWLRMPQWPTDLRTIRVVIGQPAEGARDRLLEAQQRGLRIWEEGGEVRFMAEPGPDKRGPASVEGVVYDSTRAKPLAGATVFLMGTRNSTRTRADGRFRMSDLPIGPQEIAFLHPYADALGLPVSPRSIVLTASEPTWIELSVPGGLGCTTPVNDSVQSAVSGLVYDARTGVPVAGATVTAEWQTKNTAGFGAPGRDRLRSVKTTEDGRFLFCSFPVGLELRLSGHHEKGEATIDLTIDKPGLLRQDLLIR